MVTSYPALPLDIQRIIFKNAHPSVFIKSDDQLRRYMIHHNLLPNPQWLLSWAIKQNESSLVKYMLKHDIVPDENVSKIAIKCVDPIQTSLRHKCFLVYMLSSIEMIDFILEHSNVSQEEVNAAFLEAVYKDKSNIAKYLVDRGANPHCNNDYALYAAISNENMELFDYLHSNLGDIAGSANIRLS